MGQLVKLVNPKLPVGKRHWLNMGDSLYLDDGWFFSLECVFDKNEFDTIVLLSHPVNGFHQNFTVDRDKFIYICSTLCWCVCIRAIVFDRGFPTKALVETVPTDNELVS